MLVLSVVCSLAAEMRAMHQLEQSGLALAADWHAMNNMHLCAWSAGSIPARGMMADECKT